MPFTLIKVILILSIVISFLFSILSVHTLPKTNKSLKWNLNARFYLYSLRNAVCALAIFIAFKTLPNNMEEEPENSLMIKEAVICITIFLIAFFSDRYAIRKRLKPYVKSHEDEYNRYIESEGKFAGWNTVEYAGFSAILVTVFLMFIFP